MAKALKSKYFWLLALLIAAVVFSFGINSEKKYQSEIRLLILPKSEIAAGNIEQIIENAKEIPRSLSFYDKLVEIDPSIEDGSFNLPDEKRRVAWNSKIEIKRIDKSGIISISAFGSDQAKAENISNRIADDLVIVMSKYYDIKVDLDMRRIDGPISYLVSQTNIQNWIVFSLFVGFFFSLFIFLISGIFSEKVPVSSEPVKSPISWEGLEKYDFRKTAQLHEQSKKAPAPENLPISVEPMKEEIAQPIELTHEETKHLHREATPEEVKARLNRLLRGN